LRGGEKGRLFKREPEKKQGKSYRPEEKKGWPDIGRKRDWREGVPFEEVLCFRGGGLTDPKWSGRRRDPERESREPPGGKGEIERHSQFYPAQGPSSLGRVYNICKGGGGGQFPGKGKNPARERAIFETKWVIEGYQDETGGVLEYS